MEKNLVVVYDNGIGLPFLLKPMGKQVLLLSPGIELSRLRIDNINWDLDAIGDPKGYESEFCYLCMTGESISANRMFALLMKSQEVGNEETIHNRVETLDQWGVSCTYEPVNLKIDLSMVTINGVDDYKYSGDGFISFGYSNAVCVTETLGNALKNVFSSGLFPEINVEVKVNNLGEDGPELVELLLDKIVGDEVDIHVTIKTEND